MRTIAIIQARMGSSRLPGKVLMPLGDHPVLEWCVRACRAAPGIDEVWVATSTLSADNAIIELCNSDYMKTVSDAVPFWRGSETDVLSRFVGTTEASKADIILRITGDCPFIDPQVIGSVVHLQKQTGAAYCSNVDPRTYPDGLDVECFTREALMADHAEATRPIDRDTVTYWIRRNQSRFPAASLINPLPDMAKERWVLDTKEDYEFCKAIAERWPWHKGAPSQLDILGILDKEPELRNLNANHVMNERFYDALAEEEAYPRSYSRSQKALERAKKVIPLGAQTFSKSHIQYPQPSPLFLSHGQGALVCDVDGNEYVDCVSALLPNILGYRDADVDQAIRTQTSRGISFSLATELEAELAETLCRLIPCAEMVRFGKTGTDVTTAAVRLARAYTGRSQILICGGYHGWADWSVERNLGVPILVREYTSRVPFGYVPGENVINKDPFAAIIVEPETKPEYLKALREYCDSHGTVLIFDEVITGFRFDLGGAQKFYGVTPDLACFGKAMANGMPLSAIVGRRDIMMKMQPPDNIFYSGTFFGETLSLAASIATIKKMEREFVIAKLWTAGFHLRVEATKLVEKYGLQDVILLHGQDPLVRLKFKNDKIAALFRKEMIALGTLIIASHNICAAHGTTEIKRVLKSYDHTLAFIKDAIEKDDIDKRLEGATVGPMVRAS
jgi:glutamate-1-semialdehyde 2,1-aminomutase/spore coat polysaccharide biosynthesis protein SpsF